MADNTESHFESRHEYKQMTRSDVAATKRSLRGLESSLQKIQTDLINRPVDEGNVNEVAHQLLAASQLRQAIMKNRDIIESAITTKTGGKLTQKEKKEINGYYMTGNYTQSQLAEQYGVSQPTIHNAINSSEE